MERFLERHRDRIIGTLSGFDRVLFRGTLRSISYVKGLEAFLGARHVLHKEFGEFVQKLSGQLNEHAKAVAKLAGRPYRYLNSSSVSKEDLAKQIAKKDGVEKGLVCVLACVELCQSYDLRKDRPSKHLKIIPATRKCLHFYFYYMDREFGLMHIRLQSWLPFPVQVCLNGREYLARQLDKAGIGYEQRDNCFARIDDLPRAQKIMDQLVERRWEKFLNKLAKQVNPLPLELDLHGYYWSIRQGEIATDIMFRDAKSLAEIYPALVQHAMLQFKSPDVLRFLGRGTNCRFQGEVLSDMQHRTEGVRIKHRVEENSIKMYDKQGCVLRIETTINNPRRFKVLREMTHEGQAELKWIPMRKGLADIARRVEYSRAANERYLEALSVVGAPAPTKTLLDPIQKRRVRDGRAHRALRPISEEDSRLFAAVLRGEHHLQGFRNVDIRRQLGPDESSDPEAKRRASHRIGRSLRLLRAHGLIRKVSHTQYYRLTSRGSHIMTTAQKLRELDLSTIAA